MPAEVMDVTYNGVQLKVSRVVTYDVIPVYSDDGTQILYDHIRLGVIATVNRTALALPAGAAPGAAFPAPVDFAQNPNPQTLTNDPGKSPGLSLVAIKNALTAQRKQLRVQYGTADGTVNGTPNIILESPRKVPGFGNYFRVDARYGPNPTAFKIMEIHGYATLVVYWEVETWQQKCTDYPRSVLFHRWEASHDIDEFYYTTRTVTGHAVFSAEVLTDPTQDVARAPDDFRGALFHAIPDGFQRKGIRVEADQDGCGVTYSFTDEEQPLSLIPTRIGVAQRPLGIVKVEASHNSGHDNTQANLFSNRHVNLTVRVWGMRQATRRGLYDALVDVAAVYHFDNPARADVYTRGDLHMDLVSKFAQLEMSFLVPFGSVGGVINALQPGAALPFHIGLNGRNNFIESLTRWARFKRQSCVRPINDAGARAGYLERLVAQVLNADCARPTHVTPFLPGPPDGQGGRQQLPAYNDSTSGLTFWTWT